MHSATHSSFSSSTKLAGIPLKAFLSVIAQHSSSAWSEQCLEFAAYLFLIVLFPTTLVPASVLGVTMTLGSLAMSGAIGRLVDRLPRLRFARRCILVQKICQIAVYSCFLGMFSSVTGPAQILLTRKQEPFEMLKHRSSLSKSGDPIVGRNGLNMVSVLELGVLVICATLGRLATTGIDLAVDRDWVFLVSEDKPSALTLFNTSNRRAFLLCKLLAPLFVSSFTASIGYTYTAVILLGISALTSVIEIYWVGVVWRSFPVLDEMEELRERRREGELEALREIGQGANAVAYDRPEGMTRIGGEEKHHAWIEELSSGWRDLIEFAKMPIFLSSLAVSTLYLTTLSFDGIMLSWLKTERTFSDIFISVMRGICVITGLMGTAVMPILERWLGLARAGAWSIWFEIACLVPVVLCLYMDPSSSSTSSTPEQHRRPLFLLTDITFFLSLALSRLGLYSFDLIQLQELQLTLQRHPKRNAFMAIQISMQSAFDLGKYLVVLVLNRPSEFRSTALISFLFLLTGGIIYTIHLRQVRGHLIHVPVRFGSVPLSNLRPTSWKLKNVCLAGYSRGGGGEEGYEMVGSEEERHE